MQQMTEEDRSRALDSLATAMLTLDSELAALAQQNPTEARIKALQRAQRTMEDGERALSAPAGSTPPRSADVELAELAKARVSIDADLRSMAARDWTGAYHVALSRVVATPTGRRLYEDANGGAPAAPERPAAQSEPVAELAEKIIEGDCVFPSRAPGHTPAKTYTVSSNGRCVPTTI